jgi:NAD(P)-dependent dehydrogenase (short-subunit alcohol dehydrogenase family)
MSNWTATEIPSMREKTVVVTGANSGLGFEATKELARQGATVIMACRSLDRGETAAYEIRDDLPNGTGGTLDVRHCDLADLATVKSFASGVREAHEEIHVLCNNAGVMAVPRSETQDGFEMQLGVNHLGHFALTGHLLDLLVETPGETRVVTHSSGAHTAGTIDFDDLMRERSYDKWEAYGQSKLANLHFTYELQRRLEAAGITDAKSIACHPGYADTNLQYRGPEEMGSRIRYAAMKAANTVFAQSAKKGALPLLYAATAPDAEGGAYYGPGGFKNMRGYPEKQDSNEASYDETVAKRLWEASEELTGVSYDIAARATA